MDTSAWIEWLRATGSAADQTLASLIDRGRIVWTTGVVVQEVLQGAVGPTQEQDLRTVFAACTVVEPTYPETYEHAAALYRRCRMAGRSVRGTVDCLVAAIALEHGLAVLGTDRDLQTLHEVCELRLTTLAPPRPVR